MNDIVRRLEIWLEQTEPGNVARLMNDAVAEIERLQQEVDRLNLTGDRAQIRRLQAEVDGLRAALYLDLGAAWSARSLAQAPDQAASG